MPEALQLKVDPFRCCHVLSRVVLTCLLITLLLSAGSYSSTHESSVSGNHRVLRSIGEIRRINPSQVTSSTIGVHVRGVVTYYDSVAPNLFVQDATGGIWIDLRGNTSPPPRPGQLLDLRGEVGFGFAPYIAKPEWKVIGSSAFPKPVHLGYQEAATGSFDGQWVEMEGVVRSFVQQVEGDVLVIDVATPTGHFKVRVPDYRSGFPMHLVDAKLRFRGVCGAAFNRRNQLVAIHLMVPNLEDANIVEAAPLDPFATPATSIDNLRRFSANTPDLHRVKVVGVVTARFPGKGLFLMDATGGLYAESQDGTNVQPGDEVEVIGFPEPGEYTPVLKSSSIRPTQKRQVLISKHVDGNSAQHGGYDAQLVDIVGTLHASTRHQHTYSLFLDSEDHISFEAVLETAEKVNYRLPAIGSKVLLAGICSVRTDQNGNPSGFQIVLRNPADIKLLASPPWLTARRGFSILFVLAFLTLVVLVWVMVLRKRVNEQTKVIKLRLQKEIALEERYRRLFERNPTGLYIATSAGTIVDCNDACARILGYASPKELLENRDDAESITRSFHRPLLESTDWGRAARQIVNAEHQFQRRDGSAAWVLTNARAIHQSDTGNVVLEGALVDITDRKVAEEKIQFLAYYDSLTGLPNRTLLHDRLSKALANARRHKEKVAVLFLDLDRFKIINDSLGHSFGDLLLKEVGQRLQTWAREQDTVSRVGGDEFVIILNSIKEAGDVGVAADRIVKLLSKEFVIRAQRFIVSCSIGISMFPEHGEDVETLIKNADAAMYCAKDKGRQTVRFFTDEMNTQVVERLNLENNLRQALEKQEFFLVYQPEVDVATGTVTTWEALIRWQHPTNGLIPPDKFIRVAENAGMIIPIGEWVLRTACLQARSWQEEGLMAAPVAVNVSAIQFRQDGFCETIKRVLEETGLDPQYLELELTESLLLANEDVVFQILEQLRGMGVRLAIDDFGTGYSSLSYLRQFPVGKLKIDRSFIRDAADNPDDAAITAAIINMAKSLNLKVTAEGVETEAQMALLRAHDCDEVQGFYFSRPMTADSISEKLRHANSQCNLLAKLNVERLLRIMSSESISVAFPNHISL